MSVREETWSRTKLFLKLHLTRRVQPFDSGSTNDTRLRTGTLYFRGFPVLSAATPNERICHIRSFSHFACQEFLRVVQYLTHKLYDSFHKTFNAACPAGIEPTSLSVSTRINTLGTSHRFYSHNLLPLGCFTGLHNLRLTYVTLGLTRVNCTDGAVVVAVGLEPTSRHNYERLSPN